jgi:D-alanyl-D-alanine carboxypeptidase
MRRFSDRHIAGAMLATVLLLKFGNAQSPKDTELGVRTDALVQTLLSRNIAGVSIAVARNGKAIFTRGYGSANLQHSIGVTPETVFHIDSVSKNILSAVVLQLANEGKLDLDDDVTKYVPEAPTQGHRVSVRQLLNHTSGIYSFTSLPDADANERLDLTHEQVLALFKDKPFDFGPGSAWRYNNSAFYIAGMVVERVTKQEYGTYVREHIFQPLGMSSAQMCDARTVVPHLASGYARDHDSLVNAPFLSWKLPFAAGSICANAPDLLKWQAALDEGRMLTSSSIKVMREPSILTDGTRIDYGLGTRLGSLEGHRVLGHTGSGGGFAAALASFPDDHVTVAVLINTEVGANVALRLATSIARSMIGLPEKITLKDLPIPKTELDILAGKFTSDEGSVETFPRDGKLFFRVPSGPEGPMLRQAENIYAINEDTQVHLVVRGSRVTWALVYTDGLLMDVYRRIL